MPFDPSTADLAIRAAEEVLRAITVGPPIVKRGPGGEIHIDVPLLYDGEGVDRVHFDPETLMPSPKGRPVMYRGEEPEGGVVREIVESAIRESRILDAAEYRGPEEAWAVPVAWRSMIIAHIKISYDGKNFVPDLALTMEVRKHVFP